MNQALIRWPSVFFPVVPEKWLAALLLLCFVCLAAHAQAAFPTATPRIIEGVSEGDVLAFGESIEVRGNLRQGVVVLGGDVIVSGQVAGDVGTVGGNVIQRPGSYIGGDIMVLGGTYHAEDLPENHRAGHATLVFAGYEPELRELMLNPVSFLRPHWSATYFGQRLLAILFWFIASLLLTAVSPGAVSRAVERLRLTSTRVALIGLLGAGLTFFGVGLCLRYFPTAVGAVLGAMILVLLLVAYVFGRVVLHAATGRWLQRVLTPNGSRSETVALLWGVAFWTIILSLPFVWPLFVVSLLITSLGLALTARYRINWKRAVTA